MAGGLSIGFEEGVTEPEVKQILERYDLGTGYELDYNIDWMADRYYLMVEKDEKLALKYDLWGVENWVESGSDIAKGDYYIITVWEPVIGDEEFLAILNEHNLQLKQSVWCYVRFDNDRNYSSAKELKKALEENERILFVDIDILENFRLWAPGIL
jgi:hypothetical protein